MHLCNIEVVGGCIRAKSRLLGMYSCNIEVVGDAFTHNHHLAMIQRLPDCC